MVPEAKAIAKKILAEHIVPDLDPEIVKKGDAIVAAHVRSLGA